MDNGGAYHGMDVDTNVSRRTFLFGAAGSVLVAGTSAAQANNSSGGSSGNESTSDGASGAGGSGKNVTVEVGPNGEYIFKPGTNRPLTIAPGTTVKWVWKSDLHNIVVGNQPKSTSWKGTDGPPSKTYDTGHTYTYTFNTTGKYHYWCQPHKSLGMIADIIVKQGAGGGGGGGNGSGGGGGNGSGGGGGNGSGGGSGNGSGPTVPDNAKSLGVASGFAMIATLSLSFFFLKYGGEYRTPEE